MKNLYSLEYLNSISEGDEEFIKDMIITFVKTVPEELGKLKNSILAGNWIKTGEDAHKFGSNLMYLQLDELKKIVLCIETNGLNMEHTEQIPVLFEKLSMGCHQVIEQLKKDFDYLNQ